MNRKEYLTYLLATMLLLSIFFHSISYYSLLLAIPLFAAAYTQKRPFLPLLSLSVATLYFPFFISGASMDDVFSLILFFSTLMVPLVLYWAVILIPELEIGWKATTVAASYFSLTVALFYIIPFLLGVYEFFMDSPHLGPQALLIIALGLILALSYQFVLEFNPTRR